MASDSGLSGHAQSHYRLYQFQTDSLKNVTGHCKYDWAVQYKGEKFWFNVIGLPPFKTREAAQKELEELQKQKALGRIYDLLVKNAGAEEEQRDQFLNSNVDSVEFRFGGKLGPGGKIYLMASGWHVKCHEENRNVAIDQIIRVTNERLTRLRKEIADESNVA